MYDLNNKGLIYAINHINFIQWMSIHLSHLHLVREIIHGIFFAISEGLFHLVRNNTLRVSFQLPTWRHDILETKFTTKHNGVCWSAFSLPNIARAWIKLSSFPTRCHKTAHTIKLKTSARMPAEKWASSRHSCSSSNFPFAVNEFQSSSVMYSAGCIAIFSNPCKHVHSECVKLSLKCSYQSAGSRSSTGFPFSVPDPRTLALLLPFLLNLCLCICGCMITFQLNSAQIQSNLLEFEERNTIRDVQVEMLEKFADHLLQLLVAIKRSKRCDQRV